MEGGGRDDREGGAGPEGTRWPGWASISSPSTARIASAMSARVANSSVRAGALNNRGHLSGASGLGPSRPLRLPQRLAGLLALVELGGERLGGPGAEGLLDEPAGLAALLYDRILLHLQHPGPHRQPSPATPDAVTTQGVDQRVGFVEVASRVSLRCVWNAELSRRPGRRRSSVPRPTSGGYCSRALECGLVALPGGRESGPIGSSRVEEPTSPSTAT
jgi:hypothetical protein